jgi:hypothetical protein
MRFYAVQPSDHPDVREHIVRELVGYSDGEEPIPDDYELGNVSVLTEQEVQSRPGGPRMLLEWRASDDAQWEAFLAHGAPAVDAQLTSDAEALHGTRGQQAE